MLGPFQQLLLTEAEKLYNENDYVKCCSLYSVFFDKLFSQYDIDFKNSIFTYHKELFYYSDSMFNNFLTKNAEINKFDNDDFQSLHAYLMEIKNNPINTKNEYYTKTDQKIKEIRSKFFEDEVHLKKYGPTIDTIPKVKKIPDGYPREYIYNDHRYIFVNQRKNDCRYVCSYGQDRHRGKCLCKASIALPFPLPNGNIDDIQEIQIRIIKENHTCPRIENVANLLVTDAQIKLWTEEFYFSTTPRPSRAKTISLVLEKVQEASRNGADIQSASERIVNNYYTALEKAYKKQDEDFLKMLKTERNTVFERFKYRFGNGDLIICYCSDFQEKCIPESHFLFIDGTFDIAPQKFKQVLVIMGQTSHMNMPLAYILLPNKMQSTYAKAFILFKEEVKASFRNGATFITDFEKAEFNAVRSILMDGSHRLQLCYFHFVQSMIRHFKDYPQDNLTSSLINLTKMFPFISHEVLYDAIGVMDSYDELNEFVTYFKDTYLKGYAIEDWSVYGKPNNNVITNNVAESHNNLLKREIGSEPSLTQFEVSIKKIEKDFVSKYKDRTYTPPEFVRDTDFDFKIKFREMIDIIRKRKSITKQQNSFADLYNKDDEYFADSTSHDDDLNSSSSISSGLNSDEEQPEEQEEEQPGEQREEQREEQPGEQNQAERSNGKVNIRQIPDSARSILVEKSIEFNALKSRSDSRKKLVNETLSLVSPIVPNITSIQIRSWFGNNKKKLES